MTGRPNISAAEQSVGFYATDRRAAADLCDALRRFAPDAPPARIAVTDACR